MQKYEWATSQAFGQPQLECLECHFNSMGIGASDRIVQHCQSTGHGVRRDVPSDINAAMAERLKDTAILSRRVALCYLCWNTAAVSAEGTIGLVEEALRLQTLGHSVTVFVLDNGSSDDTMPVVRKSLTFKYGAVPDFVQLLKNKDNCGISAARNQMLKYALNWLKVEYVLLLDGDIQVVPMSVNTMLRYLECHSNVGCIGAQSGNQTSIPGKESSLWTEIQESRVRSDIRCAWTQYGLFRSVMFNQGIWFDESGPFGQPGWGLEDDDLYLQMSQKGWSNCYFNGMTYLHRNLRSSWPSIERLGLNVETVFKQRQSYLLDKWSKLGLDSGILNLIRAQRLPDRA